MNKVRIEPERGEAEVGDGAGPPGGPPGGPTAQGGAESAPEAYTICVRATAKVPHIPKYPPGGFTCDVIPKTPGSNMARD